MEKGEEVRGGEQGRRIGLEESEEDDDGRGVGSEV